ncbi:cupin domain-containing protein [Umezawaea beigongshangensis]|uniref:cupin domain-containing protein n=1 Tax=Umezawaea beigongshangensis TaxID=2780383 RepID=UPI001E42CEB1|nr:cupin domain-containing protein [Umezawaea beigongshangensis]
MSEDRDMRDEHEFFEVDALPWREDPASPGVSERVLSRGSDGVTLTRIARWAPGLDTSASGVIRHQYHEEVYLLTGELTDLTSGETHVAGSYASRRPGMPHGPYVTGPGCTMLEIRTVAG